MIIIVTIVIALLGCLLLLGWWCVKMREIFILNERIQRIRDNDGKVTFVHRRKKT